MPDLGPILALHGATDDLWRLSALVVSAKPPASLTTSDGQEVKPRHLLENGSHSAWAFRFEGKLGAKAREITYKVAGVEASVHLPARGQSPQIAYASCNGFSSLKDMKRVADKHALWRRMAERHGEAPYNLLLLGGDQVYANSMWGAVASMHEWAAKSWEEANASAFTPTMEDDLRKFYFELYVTRWSQPEIARMLAQVPMIAMWDDHDIMDGWGSYPPERQNCPVFNGLWPIAREAFAVFQQQIDPKAGDRIHDAIAPEYGFSRCHKLGRLAVLVLDMRSERTANQVIGPDHWNQIFSRMDQLKRSDVDHLLVMSSIPVVYPGFDTIERVLGIVPGQQELEDDLRDHWKSRPHKGERLRLIHRLLDLASAVSIRPTILSGDVHVGAIGAIESTRNGNSASPDAVVSQLISSGVVHPGPGGMVLFALQHLLDSTDEIDRGIVARMVKFPGTSTAFIGGRNFLSLEPDDTSRIWANWFVEGETHSYVKVVHPI